MTGLEIEAGAAEAGFDPERLERIDVHFARYVADGRLPGWLLTVSRHGRLVHVARCGSRDLEAGQPVTDDTLWRIYSMTKPVTSVASMMLCEDGRLALTDPVSAFIPSFADVRVYTGGSDLGPVTVPATEPVRIWHLLTHTAGLTYGFHRVHPADALMRAAGFEWATPGPGGSQPAAHAQRGRWPGVHRGRLPPGRVICSPGELSWGGAASTAFWIDPDAGLTVSFFTQLLPSSTYPIRPQLRQLVYQALVR